MSHVLVALDYLQLLDLDLLLAVAAYDDNKAIEAITDRVQECKRCVLVQLAITILPSCPI